MQKIKNIEFLRVIGCIAIILLHLYCGQLYKYFPDITMYLKGNNILSNGQKAVDLFFIISGFFFAYLLNTKYSLWEFLKRNLFGYILLLFLL
ncbi:acyltransferase family protein [bacterium]|nr:acyltransferase family protein [bacterium]